MENSIKIKLEQAKQRGSVPRLPIHDYCPHPSNHWKRRHCLTFRFFKYTIIEFDLASEKILF